MEGRQFIIAGQNMTDIQDPRLLWGKAVLFVFLGVISAACAYTVGSQSLGQFILFWGLSVWGCCRAYYFAFYAIEKYVDPSFKYAGILSMFEYLLESKQSGEAETVEVSNEKVQETFVAKNNSMLSIVRLLAIGLIGNVLIPPIVGAICRYSAVNRNNFDNTLSILLGVLCAELAVACFLGAAIRSPLKYRSRSPWRRASRLPHRWPSE